MGSELSHNEQIATTFFKTLSAGDYDNLRRMFTDDAVWTVMPVSIPGAGPHNGPKGIVDEFLMVIREMFVDGDPKLHVTNVFSRDGWVAVETHTQGTFKGGKKYDNRYCWILEISGGKVKTVREYMDGGYVSSLM
jgi:ketosteroid isomerase-like protein